MARKTSVVERGYPVALGARQLSWFRIVWDIGLTEEGRAVQRDCRNVAARHETISVYTLILWAPELQSPNITVKPLQSLQIAGGPRKPWKIRQG